MRPVDAIQDAAPSSSTYTLSEFMRLRGYDPETRTYKSEDTPDLSGNRLHHLKGNA